MFDFLLSEDKKMRRSATQWLEMALELQQSAEDINDLYVRTSRAMVDLIGLDSASSTATQSM